MSFTITKKPAAKTKPKVTAKAVNAEELAVVQLVDKIVLANPAIAAAKEPKKEQDKAKAELIDLVGDDYTPDEPIVLKGTKGAVNFTPFSQTTECVNPKKVHEMLGDEAFYAIAKLGVTDLKKYLTPTQLALVMTDRYGSRSMSVLPLDEV